MIICAAVKTTFINHLGEEVTVVVTGYRHSNCFDIMTKCGVPMLKDRWDEEQGFITNTGEFLNRKEAFKHALYCGQLSTTTRESKKDRNEDELYSEDLY